MDLDEESSSCASVFDVREVRNLLLEAFSDEKKLKKAIGIIDNTSATTEKPIIIGEGKTDIKHFQAAFNHLKPLKCDVDFCASDIEGNSQLETAIKSLAMLPHSRPIIAVFDRDVESVNAWIYSKSSNGIANLGNNTFAILLPAVNVEEYGDKTCIEHYYSKKDLLKPNDHGGRIFLGGEFGKNGISIDSQFCIPKRTNRQNDNEAIIDSNVYLVTDKNAENNKAMSKNEFADLVLNGDYSKDFDFSKFSQLFDVISSIIKSN